MDCEGEMTRKGCHAEAQACPEFIEGKHEGKGLCTMLSTRIGLCARRSSSASE
jgi:hypothetical protein